MSESGGGLPGASPTYGGSGGNPFSDQPAEGSRICRVHVRHGDYVDGIGIAWIEPDGTFVEGPLHGGGGGTENSFTLDPGETIQVIRGASGNLVDSLGFQTSLGRTYGPMAAAAEIRSK
jgi:Jacalin-like lectin domain